MLKKISFIAFVSMLLMIAMPGVAGAHHPLISATANCDAFAIDYTATAWFAPINDARTNNNVVVTIDGVIVGSGAFTAANGFSFSGSVAADPGTYVVRVTAVPAWGEAENRGSPGVFRETSVVVPADCVPPAPPTTVVTVPPTTSTPLVTESTSTTTVPVEPPITTVIVDPPPSVPVAPPATPTPGEPTFTG